MRLVRLALAAVLAVLVLTACSGGGASDEGGDGGELGDVDVDAADGAGSAGRDVPADAEVAGEREVITTAYANVVVDDPAGAAGDLAATAEAAGGRVDQRSETAEGAAGEGSLPSASITVRVPADATTGVVDSLDDLGEVRDLTQHTEDVTQVARDLDARIEALEASTDRLIEIMADAEDSGDLIAAEDALSERQADLESLQSQRAYLADQVAMSTLEVSFTARTGATVDAGGFAGGVESGWRALTAFVSGLLVVLGVLLPWLLVVGLPAGLVVWYARHRRERTRRPHGPAGDNPAGDDPVPAETSPGEG